MGGSSFELLMQEIFNQKQSMDELLEENHNLRSQLADLRAGRGIILGICGQQFALNTEETSASPQIISPLQDSPVAEQATISMPLHGATMDSIPETPDQIEQLPDYSSQMEDETTELRPSNFLEEMLIDEFAAVSTTQIPTWKGSQTRKLPTIDEIDEDEKVALRKQLIGSFLLE